MIISEGYYFGKVNRDFISKNTVLIHVKDSIATVDFYKEEKGMLEAFNIFKNEIVLPQTDSFNFKNQNQWYSIENSENEILIKRENGYFLLESPIKIKLKYYKEYQENLFPSKHYALFCYSWFYPHILLGLENELGPSCKVYIQNNLDKSLRKIDKKVNYEEYYRILKDSIAQFKVNYEINELKKNKLIEDLKK
ncbi:MAG: hypothetical protein Q8R57_01685 [Bacteroidota bacterium]|nr:hypothetical protein [Bacteroidota bacterium]